MLDHLNTNSTQKIVMRERGIQAIPAIRTKLQVKSDLKLPPERNMKNTLKGSHKLLRFMFCFMFCLVISCFVLKDH